MSDNIIYAKGLTKSYGTTVALSIPELSIPKGKIIALLGPNGSGKTTFIKLIAGLLTPTAGEVFIDGMKPGEKTKAIVSYLPERPYFDMSMKISDCIEFFSDFYEDFDPNLAIKMLADLKIEPTARLKTLSKGTKEKLQLIMVMARRAELYLLDEPIAGVDPSAREYILNTIISSYNKEATVLISTHLISDIEPVIDRVLMISAGSIIKDADVKELRDECGMSLDQYFREVFRCSQSY